MRTLALFILMLSGVLFACLPECHPDYAEWLSVGAPESWCFPRQCRGDTDGLFEGTMLGGRYYVGQLDLALIISAWSVKEPPYGPGLSIEQFAADFDHRKSGSPYTGYTRIGTNDYCIFLEYFHVKEPPVGPGVPECDMLCPIEDSVIEGPVLSLRVQTGASFEDKDIVNAHFGTALEIGIVNSSGDWCTCYDGYLIVTDGPDEGEWTGANWVYNPTYFQWTHIWQWEVPGFGPEPEADAWYMETLSPTANSDPASGSVSSSVTYQYNGPGDVVMTLYNEFFEPVDTLTILGPVDVLSPNGGEVLVSGNAYDMTWNAADTIANVDIDYSLDNGNGWQPVIAGTDNDGLYSWDPIPVADANECLIRVSDSADTLVFDVSDEVFTIFQCVIGPIPSDLNNDCYVNLADFMEFAQSWLVCGNPFDAFCGG